MLSVLWQQAFAIFAMLVLENVLAAVVSWHFFLKWKTSKERDVRAVGTLLMFYICYIAISIIAGIYAWTIALWLFIPTVAMALIFGYIGVGIVSIPVIVMKESGKLFKQ